MYNTDVKIDFDNCRYTFGGYTGQAVCLRKFAKEVLELKDLDLMTDEQLEKEVIEKEYIPVYLAEYNLDEEIIFLVKRDCLENATILHR